MLSEASQAAYEAYFQNGIIPASDIAYMVVIVIMGIIAIWQSRVFVSKF